MRLEQLDHCQYGYLIIYLFFQCLVSRMEVDLQLALNFDFFLTGFHFYVIYLLQQEGGEFEGPEGSGNRTEGLNNAFAFRRYLDLNVYLVIGMGSPSRAFNRSKIKLSAFRPIPVRRILGLLHPRQYSVSYAISIVALAPVLPSINIMKV